MKTNWRDSLKIHPAAELFPQMTPSELMELGEDIKANGMRVPITLLQTENGSVLLDGRNRLDALAAAGCDLEALLKAEIDGNLSLSSKSTTSQKKAGSLVRVWMRMSIHTTTSAAQISTAATLPAAKKANLSQRY